jgi:hypothetical protein
VKTGFFKQVMELKMQRKNPGSALWVGKHLFQQPFPAQNV